MAENVLKLKKRAVELGMSVKDAQKADRSTLEDFIASATKKSKKKDKSTTAKKKTKTETPVKKKTTKKAAAKKSSTKKATASKSSKRKPKVDDDTGRAAIGEIDWSVESDDWNPRAGGPTERMFKALKRFKGNVDKAFDHLKDDLYDFVGKNKRNGERRTKDEALSVFKYRLNRTKYEYATRTGQHVQATNRVEYGTGEAAQASKKSKRSEKRKASTKKTERKPNRKSTTSSKKKTGKKKTKR